MFFHFSFLYLLRHKLLCEITNTNLIDKLRHFMWLYVKVFYIFKNKKLLDELTKSNFKDKLRHFVWLKLLNKTQKWNMFQLTCFTKHNGT